MGKQFFRFKNNYFFRIFRLIYSLPIALLAWVSLIGKPISAEIRDSMNNETRDIYKTFDSEDQMDQGIPSGPMELLQKLRKIGSMDDATSPSDALDEALRFFEEKSDENVPVE